MNKKTSAALGILTLTILTGCTSPPKKMDIPVELSRSPCGTITHAHIHPTPSQIYISGSLRPQLGHRVSPNAAVGAQLLGPGRSVLYEELTQVNPCGHPKLPSRKNRMRFALSLPLELAQDLKSIQVDFYCHTKECQQNLLQTPFANPTLITPPPPSGCSSMVERQLAMLQARVRFPSPAPTHPLL
jgi:hypothetical protein